MFFRPQVITAGSEQNYVNGEGSDSAGNVNVSMSALNSNAGNIHNLYLATKAYLIS